MSTDDLILNGSEEFPYPAIITRQDFSSPNAFDPDTYLYENHRFSALDSLLSDLKALSKTTNQELHDLVNNEYASFIDLGKSITGSLELINNISGDVGKFNALLSKCKQSISTSLATVGRALEHKNKLNVLKNKAKLILLLNEQCSSFETLLEINTGEDAQKLKKKVSTLATLYLSVTKICAVLDESGDIDCLYFDNTCKTKLASIKYEFRAFLDETMAMMKSDTRAYGDVILLLLHCYRILGSMSENSDFKKQ